MAIDSSPNYALALDFLAARTLAQRAFCAAAMRLRPAAEMKRFFGAADLALLPWK